MKTWHELGIDVHASSGETDTQCPWCSKDRKKKHAKCLSVNVDKGTYFCHHCGVSGGLREGHRQAGNELHWRKPVYVRPEPKPEPEAHDQALVEFMAKRSIPPSVLRRNRISLQTVYMPQVEDRVKAICFPYYRSDEFINAKYRDREKNFRMEAGAERILYGLNDIDLERVVIVEGEMDKLSVEVAGITSCVSVPDGAPAISAKNYDSKFTFLESDAEKLEAVKQWVIAVDNDPPGTRLEQELVRRFGVGKCKRVVWPEGCKDANDVLCKHGAEALRRCIDMAEEFPIRGVVYIDQLSKEIDLLYAEGESRGITTGWKSLDEFYTVQPGEVTVITGTPGSGKSNWLDALLVNLARDHDWQVALFSPENQPLRKHAARLMEKFIREPFRAGPTKRMSPERKDAAREWVSWYFPMILPQEDDDWTLDNVFQITQALILRHGIKGLVIDPWNELEHWQPANVSESQYIGNTLKRIRQFARRSGIHIWIVAHPAKLYRNKDGKYPMPTLYDISGSANWFNKPDNGIVIHRDKGDPNAPVEVHLQKVRLRETGQIGHVNFKYNRVLADYEEMVVRDAWSAPV